MLDDFHASMPEDLTDFGQVNHLRPLALPAEIAMYQEGDDRKYGGTVSVRATSRAAQHAITALQCYTNLRLQSYTQ
jgi:hypothetical protein